MRPLILRDHISPSASALNSRAAFMSRLEAPGPPGSTLVDSRGACAATTSSQPTGCNAGVSNVGGEVSGAAERIRPRK